MTTPVRPSLDEIIQGVDKRPSLDAIVARADGSAHPKGFRTPEQIARLNANDRAMANADDLAPGGTVQSAAETLAFGHPGGLGLVAGLRGATGENAPAALEQASGDVDRFSRENPRTALALKALGAAPTALASAPLRLLNLGGRTMAGLLGAGQAAAARAGSTEQPSESDLNRTIGTLKDAVIAGGMGFAAPTLLGNPLTRTALGAGAGAWLAPQGAGWAGAGTGAALAASPTATARLAGKLLPGALGRGATALSEATGTRGMVNKEMEGIQRLLSPVGQTVGAPATTGAQQVARDAAFEKRAAQLFTAAKNDKSILTDPEIVGLLNDPDVKGAFSAAERIRNAAGKPLPENVIGQREVPSKILQESGSPFTRTEDVTASVPDPQALHLTKRILRDVVDRGMSRESPIPLEDALRVQPKLQRLTDLLHDRSAPYDAADRFFQLGKTGQEAEARGYGAAKPAMRNPSAGNLGENDVAGMQEVIASQRARDPVQQTALRSVAAQGAQRGAEGQVAQQLAARGISGGRAGVLRAPILDASGPAAEQRGLAFGADAEGFNRTLGNIRAETAADNLEPGAFSKLLSVVSKGRIAPATPPEKALHSPEGQRILNAVVANPQQYQRVLSQYRGGKSFLDMLQAVLAGETGSAVGRQ